MKDVPLTKEQFVAKLNFIHERNERMAEMNELFTREFEDSIFYPYFRYEAVLVDLLKIVMNDLESDWIDYFMYELDFGKRYVEGCITEADGTSIKLATPEDLYDLLVKEFNK